MTKSAARSIGSELGRQISAASSARSSASVVDEGRSSLTAAAYRGWGIAFAVVGVLAFSFRPILIKLSYARTRSARSRCSSCA